MPTFCLQAPDTDSADTFVFASRGNAVGAIARRDFASLGTIRERSAPAAPRFLRTPLFGQGPF